VRVIDQMVVDRHDDLTVRLVLDPSTWQRILDTVLAAMAVYPE
jgi:hypothetical protein